MDVKKERTWVRHLEENGPVESINLKPLACAGTHTHDLADDGAELSWASGKDTRAVAARLPEALAR